MDALLFCSSEKDDETAREEPPLFQKVKPAIAAPSKTPERQQSSASSADEALEILRSEPGYDSLISSLRFLGTDNTSFNVHEPTPLSAQIVQVLVTAILPNYWTLLQEEHVDLELFLACLRSVTGLSALAVRLRALIAEANTSSATKEQSSNVSWELRAVVAVICKLLADESSVSELWTASVSDVVSDTKRRPLSQEYLNMVGSGRIMSLAAEATSIVQKQSRDLENEVLYWIADGKAYSQWLVRGIIRWGSKDINPEDKKLRGDLLVKAMRLGYPDVVIATLLYDLLDDVENGAAEFSCLLEQLPAHEQKKMLAGILGLMPEKFSRPSSGESTVEDASIIPAMAGLIQQIVGGGGVMQEQLVAWLLSSPGVGLENGIDVRRAAMAVVANDSKSMSDILGKSLAEFGDQLFIKHTPSMQQEAKAQVLLLAAGYVHRTNSRALAALLRTRTYLSTVSNRLSASQTRARFLGMVVGEALSGLVDGGKKLNFDMEEMQSEEAKWYKELVHTNDGVGPIDILRPRGPPVKSSEKAKQRKPTPQETTITAAVRRPVPIPKSSGFVIEELDDSAEDDDDDIVPYGKPDSDAEDSDDDPTMLRRDKPKAPVYIRDLITYFQDTENYDKQRSALTTAPILIRRKATFGTEVQQHARDLAAILVGLHDTYDMDDFHRLRLQGMVSIVVAQPKMVGPWLASMFFEGDYSLAQRASILTALGLAARELAGFDVSEHASAATFPTKQLPERVERLYSQPVASGHGSGGNPQSPSSSLRALPPGALDSIADSLTAKLLGPIAAKAADEATGPNFLKLSSFTSRLNVGRQATKPTKTAKATTTTNTAAPVIATAIFFPLAARFQLALHMLAASSSAAARNTRNVLFEPSVLSLYLKTLAVSLHAVGPGALALPDMTAELWSLLLGSSVQAHCVGDLVVTHAVLFALLALLDVNEGRMREICRDMSREVVQTRDWLMQVLQSTRAGGDGQENEVQMLAAGTYIRLTEGMESYRSLLLGEMIG
ncbi:hypothetical protein CMQ_546 [Grosmannia clavigera kw1407]|uniref:Telomere length regulation protein conserved domain-containing protein n=1 Tax=Grosmannia clavigera (strain kw1407 / UAMH 11150) TaxID=655863 RepID=F0XE49_GROCL|nr:uncharacterized protein CMQ_546 [Grosmannia clavigera kw1407]EFX03618.1 hypothetical protein CMQ_546 [Grosmannia clavigera kw1407]